MTDLKKGFEKLGIECSEKQLNQFETYMEGILSWNEHVNLTAITDPAEFHVKHFLDSALCKRFSDFNAAKNIIDVGTGAGFPGVPLAILSPDKNFVLMDSLNKRLKIIDELTAKIELTNVTTVHARAEELARNKAHREKYDLCVSRAVANLATLSEYCLPFIKKDGYLIAYKGPEAEAEIAEAKNAIRILGGEVEKTEDAGLEELGIYHKMVFIKKIKATPAKYPRKAGTPSKEPLK